MQYQWIGAKEDLSAWWHYEGESLLEIYDQLVTDGVIKFYDKSISFHGEGLEARLDTDEDNLQAYNDALDSLTDEDIKKYIEIETDNAYYQWFYEWSDEEGWKEQY